MTHQAPTGGTRREYQSPRLTVYGKLADLTHAKGGGGGGKGNGGGGKGGKGGGGSVRS